MDRIRSEPGFRPRECVVQLKTPAAAPCQTNTQFQGISIHISACHRVINMPGGIPRTYIQTSQGARRWAGLLAREATDPQGSIRLDAVSPQAARTKYRQRQDEQLTCSRANNPTARGKWHSGWLRWLYLPSWLDPAFRVNPSSQRVCDGRLKMTVPCTDNASSIMPPETRPPNRDAPGVRDDSKASVLGMIPACWRDPGSGVPKVPRFTLYGLPLYFHSSTASHPPLHHTGRPTLGIRRTA